MTTSTDDNARTAAAILARRQHTAGLLRDVQEALKTMRRSRTRVTFRAVAARAGVSRTFLYENPDARHLVEQAIAATHDDRRRSVGEQDSQIEASWRERALNAEDALAAANREILQQRQRLADVMGQIRDLEHSWSQDGIQRLVTENTSLKQRVRQLGDDNQTLTERLKAARDNARFLDRRLAEMEAQQLEPTP